MLDSSAQHTIAESGRAGMPSRFRFPGHLAGDFVFVCSSSAAGLFSFPGSFSFSFVELKFRFRFRLGISFLPVPFRFFPSLI